jgi:hypothetical protein
MHIRRWRWWCQADERRWWRRQWWWWRRASASSMDGEHRSKTKSIPAKSSQVNQNQIKPVPSQVKAHLVDDGELRVADEGDALEHRDRANNERRVGRDAEGELVRDLGEVRRELLPNPIAKYSRETNNNPLERRAGWMAGG